MASVKADRVIDTWVTLVENGEGNGERIYTNLVEELKKAYIPEVKWGKSAVNTGFMSKDRDFFMIKHDNLREYTIFVFARDVGVHLDCGWFLTVEPGAFKRMFSKKMTGDPLALSRSLDLFAQQDLAAWKHVIHRTLVKIVQDLMRDLKLDVTHMNTSSKGFLSVW